LKLQCAVCTKAKIALENSSSGDLPIPDEAVHELQAIPARCGFALESIHVWRLDCTAEAHRASAQQ